MSNVDGPEDPDDGNVDVPEEQDDQSPEPVDGLGRTAKVWKPVGPGITMPSFGLSDDIRKSMDSLSGLAGAQQQLRLNVLKPLTEFQAVWRKDVSSFVTSSVLKSTGLSQSNLLGSVADLTRGFDFGGIAGSLNFGSLFSEAFAEQQASLFRNLLPALDAMRASFYPPNLSEIDDLRLESLSEVVMPDGIPLYGVPRTSTAQALIAAGTALERRDILGRRWKTIAADCRHLVEGCDSDAVAPFRPFAMAAVDALEGGHIAAAQALTGSLADALVTARFGKSRYKYTPNKRTLTNDAYDEFTVREFLAFAPIWKAYQQFFVTNGDKVPRTYSRNATAHTVSTRQFNRRNAVQGLMLVCSLLYRLDEEAALRMPDS